jgi:hypothetical protein
VVKLFEQEEDSPSSSHSASFVLMSLTPFLHQLLVINHHVSRLPPPLYTQVTWPHINLNSGTKLAVQNRYLALYIIIPVSIILFFCVFRRLNRIIEFKILIHDYFCKPLLLLCNLAPLTYRFANMNTYILTILILFRYHIRICQIQQLRELLQ